MEKKPQENTLSSLSKHPLFSTLITFSTLLIIYLPSLFLKLLFSPVLISAAILLLTLLRLGATQTQTIQKGFSSTQDRLDQSETGQCTSSENDDSAALRKTAESSFSENNGTANSILLESRVSGSACVDAMETIVAETEMGSRSDLNDFYAKSFVEWDVRAPLEVIHEEEYDEGNGDEQNNVVSSIERYASLSLYYPESDSDGSSDGGDFAGIGGWDFPAESRRCFTWDDDEEERGEEDLIEIALDEKGRSGVVPLEDLIEIDIYPARTPARVEYNVAGGG